MLDDKAVAGIQAHLGGVVAAILIQHCVSSATIEMQTPAELIVDAYSHRNFHGLGHIDDLLQELDGFDVRLTSQETQHYRLAVANLAVMFHDIVYQAPDGGLGASQEVLQPFLGQLVANLPPHLQDVCAVFGIEGAIPQPTMPPLFTSNEFYSALVMADQTHKALEKAGLKPDEIREVVIEAAAYIQVTIFPKQPDHLQILDGRLEALNVFSAEARHDILVVAAHESNKDIGGLCGGVVRGDSATKLQGAVEKLGNDTTLEADEYANVRGRFAECFHGSKRLQVELSPALASALQADNISPTLYRQCMQSLQGSYQGFLAPLAAKDGLYIAWDGAPSELERTAMNAMAKANFTVIGSAFIQAKTVSALLVEALATASGYDGRNLGQFVGGVADGLAKDTTNPTKTIEPYAKEQLVLDLLKGFDGKASALRPDPALKGLDIMESPIAAYLVERLGLEDMQKILDAAKAKQCLHGNDAMTPEQAKTFMVDVVGEIFKEKGLSLKPLLDAIPGLQNLQTEAPQLAAIKEQLATMEVMR